MSSDTSALRSTARRHIALAATPFVVIALAALIMLASTLFYKYLFADESVWTRPWQYRGFENFGRPLITFLFLTTEYLTAKLGLYSIYVFRVSGIVMLAMTGWMVFLWLRAFNYSRTEATGFSVGLISLPAFQILASTVEPQQVASVLAVFAGLLLAPVLLGTVEGRGVAVRLLGATVLAFCAICTYQASLLLIIAMLSIPVLSAPQNLRRYIVLCLAYLWVGAVTGVYYVTWRLTYSPPSDPWLRTTMSGTYAPDAASLSHLLSNVPEFSHMRFVQIANLWYVEDVHRSVFFFASVAVVALGAVAIIVREKGYGLLKLLVAITAVPICDVFRLVTIRGPTYTTAHSVTAAWWFLVIWTIHYLAPRYAKGIAVALGLIGTALAAWTTTSYVAMRNGAQFSAIEQSLLAKPDFRHLHIFGVDGNYPQFMEYGWTAGTIDNYIRQNTWFIMDHYFGHDRPISVSGEAIQQQHGMNLCGRPDLAVQLRARITNAAVPPAGCRIAR